MSNIEKNLANPGEDPCKPPYKRGHGGFCGCNCKCLAPECWDLIKIYHECSSSGPPSPGESIISCKESQKLCKGKELNFCQDINYPCFGYDCQENGCEESPYVPGMYLSRHECVDYCDNSKKAEYLVPHNIVIEGKRCLGGICPEQPDWVCCLDGIKCAATYADCDCNCNGEKGCTNPYSPNYNPAAQCDDGSCVTCCNSGSCNNSRRAGMLALVANENIVAEEILLDFNKKEIEYLIVGSVSRKKNFGDIDILYKKTNENVEKILQVLTKYGISPLNIDHTIVECDDINLDIFSEIPYQYVNYESFKETTNLEILGLNCPAIREEDANNLIKPSDSPLPLIGGGGALGGDGYCGNNCGLPGGPGPCHPTFNNPHFVPPENSCTGEGFWYDSCYGCFGTTPPPTDYITCYYCDDSYSPKSCVEQRIQYQTYDYPSRPSCSTFSKDKQLYDSPEECMMGCHGSPDYIPCYACIKIAIGGICNYIFVPYTPGGAGQCGDFNFFDNIDSCESYCNTTTTTTTTTPEPSCEVHLTTEGCCLEYSGETIYAVGDGIVKGSIVSEELCCPGDETATFRVLINGSEDSYFASDGETIEVKLEIDGNCTCTESSKEPSTPSDVGCPKDETAKPLIILDKKTNKIKILINKKSLRS
jgi:hypothetical protein